MNVETQSLQRLYQVSLNVYIEDVRPQKSVCFQLIILNDWRQCVLCRVWFRAAILHKRISVKKILKNSRDNL